MSAHGCGGGGGGRAAFGTAGGLRLATGLALPNVAIARAEPLTTTLLLRTVGICTHGTEGESRSIRRRLRVSCSRLATSEGGERRWRSVNRSQWRWYSRAFFALERLRGVSP